MSHTAKISILGFWAAALVGIFMFIQVGSNWEYVLPRRGYKVLAMVLTGAAIAFSTFIFQTVTNNRILTPSIIGLDALYVLIQTVVIFAFDSSSIVVLNKQLNFIICLAVMVSISTALVGPVTFLGLLVANVTYEFMQTYRHHVLLASAILISIIALVGGQLLV